MSNNPDYHAAYEALMDAVDEATSILLRAQIMTCAKLRMQKGEELDEEELRLLEEEPYRPT